MADGDGPSADPASPIRRVPWLRILNVAGIILLIAVVLPFVVYAVPQVVGANHGYVVLSGSMEPAISPGDIIIVNSVDASQIEEGDIITFRQGEGRPTTHRVVGVLERDGTRAFETKGDANENVDQSLVTPDAVQGRVMSVGEYLFVIPLVGHVVQFANTQIGFVTLLVIPVVLLVISEIWDIASMARRNDRAGETADAGGEPTDAPGSEAADGAAGATGEEAAGETPGSADAEADDGSAAFGAADLELSLVVLVAFLAYGAWVAYTTTEGWALAAAGGVGATFALLSVLYVTQRGSGTDAGTDDASVTLSVAEVELGLAVLIAFLAYGAWVAYATTEGWAFGVAGAAAVAFLLVSTLYLTGGDADADGGETADAGGESTDAPGSEAADGAAGATDEETTSGEATSGETPDVALEFVDAGATNEETPDAAPGSADPGAAGEEPTSEETTAETPESTDAGETSEETASGEATSGETPGAAPGSADPGEASEEPISEETTAETTESTDAGAADEEPTSEGTPDVTPGSADAGAAGEETTSEGTAAETSGSVGTGADAADGGAASSVVGLRLSLVVLIACLAYSVWVAYTVTEGWAQVGFVALLVVPISLLVASEIRNLVSAIRGEADAGGTSGGRDEPGAIRETGAGTEVETGDARKADGGEVRPPEDDRGATGHVSGDAVEAPSETDDDPGEVE